MDEEDGRPGALAVEFGHPDALQDALPSSLRLADPLHIYGRRIHNFIAREDRWGFCPGIAPTRTCAAGIEFVSPALQRGEGGANKPQSPAGTMQTPHRTISATIPPARTVRIPAPHFSAFIRTNKENP